MSVGIALRQVAESPLDVEGAIAAILSFDETSADVRLTQYEVGVRYRNGNEIRGQFDDKAAAILFLRGMR